LVFYQNARKKEKKTVFYLVNGSEGKFEEVLIEPVNWVIGPVSWLPRPDSWLLGPVSWLPEPVSWLLEPVRWLPGPFNWLAELLTVNDWN